MKNIINFMLMILLSVPLLAQEIPPLNINNLIPKWAHILRDTNFVQDTFGSNIYTPYTVCFPNEYRIHTDQLLINNHCRSGHGNRHGNLIQNIDLATGEMNWVRALNNDNYLDNQEFYPGMFYDPDQNQVVLKGFRKYGAPETSQLGWFGLLPSLPSTIKLNAESGKIAEHHTNQDVADTIQWKPLVGRFLQTTSNSYWLAKGEYTGDGFHYSVSNMTNDQKLITSPSLSFYPDRDFDLPYISENIDNIYGTDDNNNVYGMVLQKEIFENQPLSINLYKLHINEKTNVTDASLDLVYKKDLSPYLRLPESIQGFFTRLQVYDDKVYLSMLYIDTLQYVAKRWLLCMDADGNELFYIKGLTPDGIHPSQTILFIGRKNGKVYIALDDDENTTPYSRTIISIDDQGNFQKHGKIQSEDSNAKIFLNRGLITEKDEIVLAAQVNNQYYYTACYDAKDFGIDFSSATEELSPAPNYQIYPNPSSHIVYINAEKRTPKDSKVVLLDLHGNMVLSRDMVDTQMTINVSDLPIGIYFVKIISDKGELLYINKIIKIV